MDAVMTHRDLEPLRASGELFDVSDAEMEKNIGRTVRFTNPKCDHERELFTITELQKNYRGKIIYRGLSESDRHHFGKPLDPSRIEFVG